MVSIFPLLKRWLTALTHRIPKNHLLTMNSAPPRKSSFWLDEIGHSFSSLLQHSSYPEDLYRQYIAFYGSYVVPLLGPSPYDLNESPPCSYMGDDKTPIEFSLVLGKVGASTVRFTMEPISANGSPAPPATWMASLIDLSQFAHVPDFDLSWSQICFSTLICPQPPVLHDTNLASQHCSQFSIGADLTRQGIVGKAYFLPHIRSQMTGQTRTSLITSCMAQLQLVDSWNMVLSYLGTLPEGETIPEIVAVDCLKASKNRAKVYVRTQASSLRKITEIMTLDGALSGPAIDETLATLGKLWRLLFGDIDEDTKLVSMNPKHYASGFSIYFEMSVNRAMPTPKAYIPVRHYCANDAQIADAMAKYYSDSGLENVGCSYASDIASLFPHRSLRHRSGIQTYIGCAARDTGPQVSLYFSPEAFAPERLALFSAH